MPVVAEWGGRLHVLEGLLPNRASPAHEHWSLGMVADGTTEAEWRAEAPLPQGLGGSHVVSMWLKPQWAGEQPVVAVPHIQG